MKTKLIILMMVLMFASLYAATTLCSGINDKSDQLSQAQSNTFSPGYINASKQKTDAIINQLNPKKSFMEKLIESVQGKVSDKVVEDASERVEPELKRKTSATGENRQAADKATILLANNGIIITDAAPDKIDIGKGAEQVRNTSGVLISEKFGDKTYWYAGFDANGATLKSLEYYETYDDDYVCTSINVGASAGDVIILRGGTSSISDQSINLNEGVSLYGGYLADGTRDLTNSRSVLKGQNGVGFIDNYWSYYSYSGRKESVVSGIDGTNLSVGPNMTVINCKFQSGSAHDIRNANIINSIFGNADTDANGDYSFNSFLSTNIRFNGNTFYGKFEIAGGNAPLYNGTRAIDYYLNDNKFMGIGMVVIGDCDGDPETSGFISVKVESINNEFEGSYKIDASMAKITSQGDHYADGSSFNNITGDGYSNVTTLPPNPPTLISSIRSTPNLDSTFTPLRDYMASQMTSFTLPSGKTIDGATLATTFKGLLADKDSLMASGLSDSAFESAFMARFLANAARASALAVPAINADAMAAQMEAALTLADIMKNPTEDQKMMLEAVTALLAAVDMANANNENPELKKAEDSLLQAVASIMLAQAIPDLLKEGDIANVKNIFSELNISKSRIILEYQESTKPYYDNVVKELSKNMQLLQLKNALSKSMTQEQLEKLSRSELDKIMEKLKNAANKSFEEEYILQQEAKYRKQFIDPNKKMLEDKMKDMMSGFTQRLSKVLEGAKPEKK